MILGGGCFWCTEAIFKDLKGVEQVVSGYAGGYEGGNAPGHPTYKEVCSGRTGHAEVVQITYDDAVLDAETLLEIFMTTHDPTTLNRQGADVGTMYRSVIFYQNEAEKELAEKVVQKMKPLFDDPIVTEITAYTNFYVAEDYHQNYFANNPAQGYCNMVIHPKVQKFKKRYQELLKN